MPVVLQQFYSIMKSGIILINLGSPDSTSVKDVRKYLTEFLMDEKVIDISYMPRTILVKGLIVPFRAPKSAAAYRSIWTENGSPLIDLTKQLQQKVQQQFDEPVEIAMRYGNPSPKKAYDNLLEKNPDLKEVIIFPLYPHYAMSSYETAVDYMKQIHEKNNYQFKLSFIKPYYNNEDYINALAESIKPFLQQEFDHLLFSYHGIPERHLHKTDIASNHCLQVENCCNVASPAHAYCYRHQVFLTTKLVTKKLNIEANKYSISFQSRLGKGWLKPFTDVHLKELPANGIKKLLIVCPAFVSDCLETLEEIAIREKENFLQAGGENFTLIPCLNTQPLWIKTITKLIKEHEAKIELTDKFN
ncbi:MAG: ferrochelatase [Chitinophagaceae bacterium]